MDATANDQALGNYITGTHARIIPSEVLDAARLCLADWLGVALGAADEPAGRIVRETALAPLIHGIAGILWRI